MAGQPCIGLTIACHQRYPGVLETSRDFTLVDEAGNSVLVQMADARMLGASNVNLTDANARRMLIASLDLPVGAVATGWDAYGLRDGDPVMVIGFKQEAMDPTQHSLRAPPARAVVASMAPRPLLVYPIAAERKPRRRRAPPACPRSLTAPLSGRAVHVCQRSPHPGVARATPEPHSYRCRRAVPPARTK